MPMKTIASLTITAVPGVSTIAVAQEALTQHQVQASLEQQGYTKVRDLVRDMDFKDGVWSAKADDSAGKHVALLLNPAPGPIIGADDR